MRNKLVIIGANDFQTQLIKKLRSSIMKLTYLHGKTAL